MTTRTNLFSAPIRGLLLDVTGVLYNCGVGDGEAIDGSIDAFQRLDLNLDLAWA